MRNVTKIAAIFILCALPVEADVYLVNCTNEDASDQVALKVDTENQAISLAGYE